MILSASVEQFKKYLVIEEKSPATIQKYIHDINFFLNYISSFDSTSEINKEIVLQYKQFLMQQFKASTINSMIIPLNKFFIWQNRSDLCIKTIRLQRHSNYENTFTREEYQKLLKTALTLNMPRIYFIMRILASTGIRIGELKYITYNALFAQSITVYNKKKQREIYIPYTLCEELKQYCKQNKLFDGIIFSGRQKNKLIDLAQIWRDLSVVGHNAGMQQGKVHAHNFRHFFAKMYLEKYSDLADLADILGHSSIETTRLYTRTSSTEKRKRLEALNL